MIIILFLINCFKKATTKKNINDTTIMVEINYFVAVDDEIDTPHIYNGKLTDDVVIEGANSNFKLFLFIPIKTIPEEGSSDPKLISISKISDTKIEYIGSLDWMKNLSIEQDGVYKISDNNNNQNIEWTFSFKNDYIAPYYEYVENIDKNNIMLIFSKSIQLNVENIEISDNPEFKTFETNKSLITFVLAQNEDTPNGYILRFTQNLLSDNKYYLKFKGDIYDKSVAQNKMVLTEEEFTTGDFSVPNIELIYNSTKTTPPDKPAIIVNFNKEIKNIENNVKIYNKKAPNVLIPYNISSEDNIHFFLFIQESLQSNTQYLVKFFSNITDITDAKNRLKSYLYYFQINDVTKPILSKLDDTNVKTHEKPKIYLEFSENVRDVASNVKLHQLDSGIIPIKTDEDLGVPKKNYIIELKKNFFLFPNAKYELRLLSGIKDINLTPNFLIETRHELKTENFERPQIISINYSKFFVLDGKIMLIFSEPVELLTNSEELSTDSIQLLHKSDTSNKFNIFDIKIEAVDIYKSQYYILSDDFIDGHYMLIIYNDLVLGLESQNTMGENYINFFVIDKNVFVKPLQSLEDLDENVNLIFEFSSQVVSFEKENLALTLLHNNQEILMDNFITITNVNLVQYGEQPKYEVVLNNLYLSSNYKLSIKVKALKFSDFISTQEFLLSTKKVNTPYVTSVQFLKDNRLQIFFSRPVKNVNTSNTFLREKISQKSITTSDWVQNKYYTDYSSTILDELNYSTIYEVVVVPTDDNIMDGRDRRLSEIFYF